MSKSVPPTPLRGCPARSSGTVGRLEGRVVAISGKVGLRRATVVRIEFKPADADRIIATHSGVEVDYAINLWSKTF